MEYGTACRLLHLLSVAVACECDRSTWKPTVEAAVGFEFERQRRSGSYWMMEWRQKSDLDCYADEERHCYPRNYSTRTFASLGNKHPVAASAAF